LKSLQKAAIVFFAVCIAFPIFANGSSDGKAAETELNAYSIMPEKYATPIFPAVTITGHISRDGIGKAIRNLGGKGKYLDKASAHGFRATFKTICTLNLAQLGILGISNKTVENALAHKELNNVRFAYERQTATIAQNRILMQWYSNYLNNIVKFI